MNSTTDVKETAKIMAEFQRESEKNTMNQEMLEEALEDGDDIQEETAEEMKAIYAEFKCEEIMNMGSDVVNSVAVGSRVGPGVNKEQQAVNNALGTAMPLAEDDFAGKL